jgi:hypothetical protein
MTPELDQMIGLWMALPRNKCFEDLRYSLLEKDWKEMTYSGMCRIVENVLMLENGREEGERANNRGRGNGRRRGRGRGQSQAQNT